MTCRRILSWLAVFLLSWTITACKDSIESVQAFNTDSKTPIPKVEKIKEVPPPPLIQQLKETFAYTKPKVQIISPGNNETLNSQQVAVRVSVEGLELFKDEELQMGPHLLLFLDNQPPQEVYSTEEPILLSNLAPGTHTIRVIAAYPWNETFKNPTAYAQTIFHVFTPTDDNNPSPNLPLLTYNQPQGVYGAEPLMLDFYLTNAPLHVVARENPQDDIVDWRIRTTVNGESFLLDTWETIYLQGFQKGTNWVKLEYVDENGNVVNNAFNSTVRAVEYDPSKQDTLAQLVTGKIPLEKAKAIVIKNYKPVEETQLPTETIPPVKTETTPPAETPQAETKTETTPPAETPQAETKTETTPPAETPQAETKTETTPPAETPQAETKTEITPPAETPQAETKTETTPPAEVEETTSTTPTETPESQG
ncbi:MAG: hypothetical protein RML10_06205 [Geminocystis sp.]|nr:hypothetical protein [Geminocystis sp.]